MTTQEAIDILQNTSFFGSDMDDIDTAIAMAIRSLEAWGKVKKDIHNFKGMDTYICCDGLYKWIKAKDVIESIDKHLEEVEK